MIAKWQAIGFAHGRFALFILLFHKKQIFDPGWIFFQAKKNVVANVNSACVLVTYLQQQQFFNIFFIFPIDESIGI